MRSETELQHEIAHLGADAADTPAEILRLTRPRSMTGSDSDDDESMEGVDDASSELKESKDTHRQSAITSEKVVLTSDKAADTKSGTPTPIDHVYELNKADVDDPKDAPRQSSSGQYEIFRTFVHGLEYINELVMMADGHGIYYVLQDANYNVIALIESENFAQYVMDYDPYGQMRWRSNWPNSSWTEHEYNAFAQIYNYDLPGFQGGTQDRETGLICFGARCYDPDLGRWLQADPNGTGLILPSGTRYQGQTPRIRAQSNHRAQDDDGLNYYLFLRSSPLKGTDPSGLSLLELLSNAVIRAEIAAISFVYTHPLAMQMVGGLLAAANLYAFAMYEEARAVVLSQPNPIGVLTADILVFRMATGQVTATGGNARALGTASAQTLKLAGAAAAHVQGQFVEKTGQVHHAISKKIWDALQKHRVLRGLFQYRDTRFATQAIDLAAHNGYEHWHRDLDAEVVEWISKNVDATQSQFEEFLRWRYHQPDLLERFPDGLPALAIP